MPRKFTTDIEYEAFFKRIEETFDPEEMTQERLSKWLRNETLADQFAATREIFMQVKEEGSIKRLKDLKHEAGGLAVHKERVLEEINRRIEEIKIIERERKIARSITQLEEFARRRNIVLNERTVGKIEIWGKRGRVAVIRTNGKFRTWGRIGKVKGNR